MRPLVLLLLVVPTILHAYPQRQSDRRHIDTAEATATSRGAHKFVSKDETLLEESWSAERTQPRQSSRQQSPTRSRGSTPRDSLESNAVSSRRRTPSRRADTHVAEPETASSVLTPVTQQLTSSRRTQQFQRRNPQQTEETTPHSESPRRRTDSAPSQRRSSRDEDNSRRRSRTSASRGEVVSTESSRRSRNGKREPAPTTEIPRRPGRRSGGATSRRQHESNEVTSTSVQHSTTTLPSTTQTTTTSTEPSTSAQPSVEPVLPVETANTTSTTTTTTTTEAPVQSEVTDTPRTRNNKAQESPDARRHEATNRSSRKLETSSNGNRRRNGDNNIVADSVSSANTRDYRRRPSNEVDIEKIPRVSNNIPRTQEHIVSPDTFGETHADVTRTRPGGSSRRTPTDAFPEEGRRTSSRSGVRKNEEIGAQRTETAGRGQFRNGSGHFRPRTSPDAAETTTLPRTHQRSSARPAGTRRDESTADVASASKPRGTHKGDREAATSRSRDASNSGTTRAPFKSRDAPAGGGRRGHFKAQEAEYSKEGSTLKPKVTQQSRSSAEVISEQVQNQEMLKVTKEFEEIQEHEARAQSNTDLEDSFITRSSHQVVTVTAYPYSDDQNFQSDGSRRGSSRSRTKAADGNQRSNRFTNTVDPKTIFRRSDADVDVNKIKPRTANLLLAPSPPSNSAENSVEEGQRSKVLVVGGYSRLRGSKFSKTPGDDSSNSEDNNVLTTAAPFTRFSSRKTTASTANNEEHKLLSTTPKGRSRDKKETSGSPTTESRRQVPTPPPQNSAVFHTNRSGFKNRHASTTENLPPSITTTILTTTKPKPRFPFLSNARKSLDSQIASVIEKEGSAQNKKLLKDATARSTSSFRRSVGPSTVDNRIPTTTSVSVVTSQSVPANIPRFSSRYRSELLRATGHGLKGTTTPVYMPTVPTVSTTTGTTSTTEQTMFSAIGKMASFLGSVRSELRSPRANQL